MAFSVSASAGNFIDKTGTLTRNEMAVTSVATVAGVYAVQDSGYAPAGEILLAGRAIAAIEHPTLAELGRVAALCSDASLREHEGDWTVEGDPMEGALLAFAGKTGVDWRDERSTWTRTDAIPFDAKHRFMATLHHDHEGHAFVFVKGAPERIIAMCREQRSASGGVQPLEEGFWHETADRIASQGQRVLALADDKRVANPKNEFTGFSKMYTDDQLDEAIEKFVELKQKIGPRVK